MSSTNQIHPRKPFSGKQNQSSRNAGADNIVGISNSSTGNRFGRLPTLESDSHSPSRPLYKQSQLQLPSQSPTFQNQQIQIQQPQSTSVQNNIAQQQQQQQQLQQQQMRQSSSQNKKKLLGQLSNVSPKSPSSIYASLAANSTSGVTSTTSNSSSRHSKMLKLNNFFKGTAGGATPNDKAKIQVEEDSKQNLQQLSQIQQQSLTNISTNANMSGGTSFAIDKQNKTEIVMNDEGLRKDQKQKSVKNYLQTQLQIPPLTQQQQQLQIQQQQSQQFQQLQQIQQISTQSYNQQQLLYQQHQQYYTLQQQQYQQQIQQQLSQQLSSLQQFTTSNSNNNQLPTPSSSNNSNNLNSFVTKINKGDFLTQFSNKNTPSNNSNAISPSKGNQMQQLTLSQMVPINSQANAQNKASKEKKVQSNNISVNQSTSLEPLVIPFAMNSKLKKSETPSQRRSQSKQQKEKPDNINDASNNIKQSFAKPPSKKASRPQALAQSENSQRATINKNSKSSKNNTDGEGTAMEIEENSNTTNETTNMSNYPNIHGDTNNNMGGSNGKPKIKSTYYNQSMAAALKHKPITAPSGNYFESLFKEHFIQSFHSLQFCKNLKPVPLHIIQSKRISLPILPQNSGKKTIVFDLDETLIHCNENIQIPADVVVPIKFPNNELVDAGINIRPFAKECLQELSKYFEIIVFTASHGCYATKVIQQLDPEERESCVQTEEGIHVKDLRVFGNRNLKDMVLVDNAAYSFGLQLDNGIPIIPFYENKGDQELKYLQQYLLNHILDSQDVRETNKQYFKMNYYQQNDKLEIIAKKIYHV